MARYKTISLCKRKCILISNHKLENHSKGLLTLVPPRFSSIPSVVQSASRSAKSAALQQLLSELTSSGNAVVALGGGALSQPENRAALERSGFPRIFLDAPVEVLFRRCA